MAMSIDQIPLLFCCAFVASIDVEMLEGFQMDGNPGAFYSSLETNSSNYNTCLVESCFVIQSLDTDFGVKRWRKSCVSGSEQPNTYCPVTQYN
jgi:hypothetical protein